MTFPKIILFTTKQTEKRSSHFAAGAIISTAGGFGDFPSQMQEGRLKIVLKALGKGGGDIGTSVSWTKFICLLCKNVCDRSTQTYPTMIPVEIPPGFVALLHRNISQSTNGMLLRL